jgi:excinuclease ABC subunit A
MTEPIRLRGARENNLADLDLDLDPRAVTVVCGPSGSGKSTLALDVLHAEGQRRYVATLPARDRAMLSAWPRPDVASLQGLPPTVALLATPGSPTRRSTLGTLTEIDASLRVLFGRLGVLHDPADGAPLRTVTQDQIVEDVLAVPGVDRVWIEAPLGRAGPDGLELAAAAGFSRVRLGGEVRRIDDISPRSVPADAALTVVVDRLRLADDPRDRRARLHDAVRTALAAGSGVVEVDFGTERRRYADRPRTRAGVVWPAPEPSWFRRGGLRSCTACAGEGGAWGAACATCEGTGLDDIAGAVRLSGLGWRDAQRQPLATVLDALARLSGDPRFDHVFQEMAPRFDALVAMGLGAQPLGRPVGTLSAGEWQRARVAAAVGASLSGVLYVLDEPTAGLDAAGVEAVLDAVGRLRARGNGVVWVDHDPRAWAVGDRVLELGPGPGPEGGRLVFDGTPDQLAAGSTPSGAALRGERALPLKRLPVRAAVDVEGFTVAEGGLTAIVGPNGAGKSAALDTIAAAARRRIDGDAAVLPGLRRLERLVVVDDSGVGRSRRSCPATYVGLWDVMRDLLAATPSSKVRGLAPSAFSLATRGGRCEACRGLGRVPFETGFLAGLLVVCEACGGRRFLGDVLEVRYKGLSASDLLDTPAAPLLARLAGHPGLEAPLRALVDAGLGYVPVGQPTDTLSGGEGRRLRIARELVRAARSGPETLVLMDEPAAGLHPSDVEGLRRLIARWTSAGATVVVATHHPALIADADRVTVVQGLVRGLRMPEEEP